MNERGEGYLYQRGRTWWVGYYHHGRYIRESLHTADEDTAKRLRRKKLKLTNTPHFVGPDQQRVTFDDLARLYLADYTNNGRRSVKDAERIVKQLRGTFGFDRALAITTDRIETYKAARLREGRAKATVNRELSALRRMFSLAVRAGQLAWRPSITLLDESDNVREGFLDPAQFAAVCTHLPGDIADAATFAYATGWRRGEVVGLEWARVTLGQTRGTIFLPPKRSKNKKPRILVLTGDLLALLQRRAACRGESLNVFHRDGKPIRSFRGTWAAACTAAGFTGRLFHDLRRSAVRNMVRARVPEKVAMKISGHETRSIFDRYNIVSEDDIASGLERTAAHVKRERQREKVVSLPNTHNSRTIGVPDTAAPEEPVSASA